ncbi:sigma-70 family RNA polymerase sigma factor [Conexibacter sp. W3-3-2]|uniref:RNA polymerase sigma factor n=1 Tax=Conexibacter sp. W3-3-2 TaxID=2675227 RepID=UPI0012B8CE6C|nr:sigma-70 family RNA polymerase sigma factor [Conexibacter sp. W3-3-2]MTD46509.1 sigma-70 family RNA polymerase sigma factor [Conexibacter sp. W3-3-2]
MPLPEVPPPSVDHDVLLVRRALDGDDAAFTALVTRHRALVERVIRPLVPHGVSDVAQTTFLSAWLGLPRFDPAAGTFANWVCAIARNRALDALRAERRHRALRPVPLEAVHADLLVDPAARPHAVAERHSDARDLRVALRALDADQRTVIGLSYVGGLSQGEIQRHLGVPLGTVKGRTRRGLAVLRRELAAHA